MTEMDSVRWARIGAVFNDVADLPPAERIAQLSKIGESDPELRRAVENLLAADPVADRELERFDFGLPDLILESAGPLADVRDPLGIIGHTVSHFRVVDLVASGG